MSIDIRNVEDEKSSIELKTPSSLRHIGTAISAFNLFLKKYGVTDTSASQATVVLRELLVNGMKHGNRYNTAYDVHTRIEHIQGKKFKIEVEDRGGGFDYESIETVIPEDPRCIHKRGFILIKAYSDRFEFNKKGNRVTAYISAL